MSNLVAVRLVGTTIADGTVTVTSEGAYSGLLHMVQWIDGDLTDGVDAVLSVTRNDAGVDNTLLTLTNANSDAVYFPRYIVHSEAGAALTGTSGGDRCMHPVLGKLQLAITSGGDAHTGGCIVILEC